MIPLAILMGHQPPLQHQVPESAIRRNVAWLNPAKLPERPVEKTLSRQRLAAAQLRQDILEYLDTEGPAPRGEIQEHLGVDYNRADYALQLLRAEGLIDYTRLDGWHLVRTETQANA